MGASAATGATVARPPRPPEPLWENIPEQLIAEPRWVLWQYQPVKGKYTKIPVQPDGSAASSTDPSTWASFDFVQSAYFTGGFDGIGFVFNGDGVSGFDFDYCINGDGILEPKVAGYLEQLDTYCEITPSGSGVHAIVICGELPGPDRKAGSCEIYRDARYFTVTGRRLEGALAEVNACDEAAAAVYLDIFAERIAKRSAAAHAGANGNCNGVSPISSLDDAQLLDRARKAKNGDRFAALYDRGDSSGQGFPSQSEADLALCSMLAFWCGRDAGRIDALFRGSALMRDKWLRDDYRERTLSEAIAGCRETFGEGSAGANGNGVARANASAGAQRAEQTVEGHEPQPPTPYSEIALSNRFAETCGRDFHHAGGAWWHYDKDRGLWLSDETLRVFTEVKRFNTAIAREVCDAAAGDEDASKAARKFASELTAAKKVAAVENLTRSHSAIVITLDRFDRDIWTLNTPGGVVELREGTIRPTRRDDLFTKSTPVAPRDIPTPMFDRFLREIMGAHVPPAICKCAACAASVGGPDEERQALHDAEIQSLVDYLLRLYGYCLSGDISNHILVILLGDGGNGKTQLTDFVAQDILGLAPTGYSASLPIEALLAHKTDRHPTELMSLFHTRLALASEPSSGVSWNEGLVMRLTGGEPVTARAMRQDFITFAATHKLFVVGNTAPT